MKLYLHVSIFSGSHLVCSLRSLAELYQIQRAFQKPETCIFHPTVVSPAWFTGCSFVGLCVITTRNASSGNFSMVTWAQETRALRLFFMWGKRKGRHFQTTTVSAHVFFTGLPPCSKQELSFIQEVGNSCIMCVSCVEACDPPAIRHVCRRTQRHRGFHVESSGRAAPSVTRPPHQLSAASTLVLLLPWRTRCDPPRRSDVPQQRPVPGEIADLVAAPPAVQVVVGPGGGAGVVQQRAETAERLPVTLLHPDHAAATNRNRK